MTHIENSASNNTGTPKIRLDWVPSAYREEMGTQHKPEGHGPGITALYTPGGITGRRFQITKRPHYK